MEDSDEDVEAVQRALTRSHPGVDLERLADAGELVTRLLEDGRPLPALVLLDLNMPGLDGRSALVVLREHPRLSSVPVVVFTSSTNPQDVDRAYAAGANGYLVKPVDFDLLQMSLGRTVSYWLSRDRPAE